MQDSGAYGHFTDSSGNAVTLGIGHANPSIVVGLTVNIGTTQLTILAIAGKGSESQAVQLSATQTNAAISSITPTAAISGGLTLNETGQGSTGIFTKSLAENPWPLPYYKYGVRQLIRPSELSASGSIISVTLQASAVDLVGENKNVGLKLAVCSIVERSGTTSSGVTTPTRITFNNGQDGCAIVPGGTITSDQIPFTLDHTKSYLLCMDIDATGKTTGTNSSGGKTLYWNTVAPSTARSGGSGFYSSVLAYGATSQVMPVALRNSINDYTVASDTNATQITLGVSSISVTTSKHTPATIQVATTNSTSRVPVYFIDSLTGVAVSDSKPGTAALWYAVSFDDQVTWKVYMWDAWEEIARNNAGTWQYNNGASTWVNASQNNMKTALQQAMAISTAQWSSIAVNATTSAQWQTTGGVIPKVTEYLDFAFGLQADANKNIPFVSSITVSYSTKGVTSVQGFINGAWQSLDDWTDGTVVDGIPWAQSGKIEGSEVTLDYATISNVPGFFLKITTQGTSSGTTLSRLLYKAPCQPLQNIGDGQPNTPNGFIYWNSAGNSTQDYTSEVSDNTISNFSSALVPMQPEDYLYVGFYLQFDTIEMTPFTTNNTASSVLTMEYWNGSTWAAVDIVDGTTGGTTITLSAKGKITWTLPADWKQNIPFDAFLSRAYWVRFKVSVALTSTAAIAECRVYCVPPALKKHKHVEVAGDKVFLAGRPDAQDQVDISRELEEYGFIGDSSGSFRVGGVDGIVALSAAYNTLFAWKPGSVHQFVGDKFQSAEAAGRAPINAQCLVRATTNNKTGLFFINRHGGYFIQGLHTDSTWNTAAITELSMLLNCWDSNATPRIDIDYLHNCCAEYWPKKGWVLWSVPMILSGTSEQKTNNVMMVFDLNLGCWYPPFIFPFGVAALCTAYTRNENAPQKLGDLVLLAGDYEGRVIRLFDPAATDDCGDAIDAYVETGWLHLGDLAIEKELRSMWLHGQKSGDGVTIQITGRKFAHGAKTEPTITRVMPLSVTSDIMSISYDNQINARGHLCKFHIGWTGPAYIHGLTLGIRGGGEEPGT